MNGWPLLGLLLIAYAGMVVFIAAMKPQKIWQMAKIRAFIKVLGEKGTVNILLYMGAACAGYRNLLPDPVMKN